MGAKHALEVRIARDRRRLDTIGLARLAELKKKYIRIARQVTRAVR
jgi:hypothetical protein